MAGLAVLFAIFAVGLGARDAGSVSPRATKPAEPEPQVESPPESSVSGCIGIAVDSDQLEVLVQAVAPLALPIGEARGVRVERWEDPSGARLVFETTGEQDPDLLPSFAARTQVRLSGIRMLDGGIAMATVVNEQGQPLTSLAVLIEQRRLLPEDAPVDALASIAALGTWVSVHRSAGEFEASDLSSEGPVHFAQESFGSHAVLLDPAQAQAFAHLSGTVLAAERRTVTQTGQQIIVAKVRTAGFEVTMCLEAATHPELPPIGAVISGTVFMVGSLDAWDHSEGEAR
jgi:hypothetical protein